MRCRCAHSETPHPARHYSLSFSRSSPSLPRFPPVLKSLNAISYLVTESSSSSRLPPKRQYYELRWRVRFFCCQMLRDRFTPSSLCQHKSVLAQVRLVGEHSLVKPCLGQLELLGAANWEFVSRFPGLCHHMHR